MGVEDGHFLWLLSYILLTHSEHKEEEFLSLQTEQGNLWHSSAFSNVLAGPREPQLPKKEHEFSTMGMNERQGLVKDRHKEIDQGG